MQQHGCTDCVGDWPSPGLWATQALGDHSCGRHMTRSLRERADKALSPMLCRAQRQCRSARSFPAAMRQLLPLPSRPMLPAFGKAWRQGAGGCSLITRCGAPSHAQRVILGNQPDSQSRSRPCSTLQAKRWASTPQGGGQGASPGQAGGLLAQAGIRCLWQTKLTSKSCPASSRKRSANRHWRVCAQLWRALGQAAC